MPLGSLLSAGAPEKAFVYLRQAAGGPNPTFALTRLGRLCRDEAYLPQALDCYERALVLEPWNRWAMLGRAEVLSELPDTELLQLVETFETLPALLNDGPPGPVLWTAYRLMRAVSHRRTDPVVVACARALQGLARSASKQPSDVERVKLRERLQDALALAALPLPAVPPRKDLSESEWAARTALSQPREAETAPAALWPGPIYAAIDVDSE